MKSVNCSRLVSALFALLICSGVATAQSVAPAGSSSADLIGATQEYKVSTEALLRIEEEELKKSTEKLEQLRQLFTDGLLAKVEFEEAERELNALRIGLEERRSQISDSERLITETKRAEELAKIAPPPTPSKVALTSMKSSNSSSVVIRHTGKTLWTIANLALVQSFFSTQFGRSLPVSALGQTATHNKLGWDHRHAVDVGLHPDSVEGRTLINFLQRQGITFLAFRGAVSGVSTGPHIHIGAPSHRLG